MKFYNWNKISQMSIIIHATEFKYIKEQLAVIGEQEEALKTIRSGICNKITEAKVQTISKIVCEASKNISKTLEDIKKNLPNIEKMLYNLHVEKFRTALGSFQTEMGRYKKDEEQMYDRQLRYVVPESTPEQRMEWMEKGLVESIITKDLDDAVEEIENRHERIVQLVRTVEELMALFTDLAVLVDVQGETLNVIENHVENAKNYTEQGGKDLVVAEKVNKKNRKCMCCIAGIVMVIIVAVLASTLSVAKI